MQRQEAPASLDAASEGTKTARGGAMRKRAGGEVLTLVCFFLLFCLGFAHADEGRTLKGRHHSRIRVTEEGKPATPEKNVYKFTINPEQGNAGGGSQVTLTLNSEFPENSSGNFWCKFGEKVVPAQSFFQCDGGRCIICQAPSAPARQYPVKVSSDGEKFHTGPRFLYYS